MHLIFEISTINYKEQKIMLEKAMHHLEGMCNVDDGFSLGRPLSRLGWTFFNLEIKPNLLYGMEKELKDILDMIRGRNPEEKIDNFMSDFLETRDCEVKIKLVNY
jgi:hypothetical protein